MFKNLMRNEMINAVSYSRLNVFEECPKRALLSFFNKIPEPKRGDPPKGKQEWPDERGSRVHKTAENYVRGASSPCVEMEKFLDEFRLLNKIYIEDNTAIELEAMWCFTRDWSPTVWNDWDNIWLRIKTDCTVFFSPEHAVVIDYKTGRQFGNEVAHTSQSQLYAIGAFMRYPALEVVDVELWYLDHDGLMRQQYRRDVAMKYFKTWEKRLSAVTDEKSFKAKPNQHSCRYCPYKSGLIGKFGPEGTGDCELNP